MPIVPYLPKGKGTLMEGLERRGVWKNSPTLIKDLPEELDIKVDASRDALTAIPTVRARPMLFAEALTSSKHPLHEEVTKEWRGLLGVFCFGRVYSLRIDLKPADIRLSNNRLAEILRTLGPTEEDEGWDKVFLVHADGVLLGGSSPRSLFFTPPEYELPASISWQTPKGFLGDPAEYFKRHEMLWELGVLKKWVEGVTGDIRDSKLTQLLEDWVEYIDKVEPRPLEIKDFGLTDISKQIPFPYSTVARYADVEKERRGDFYLRSLREPQKDLVVVWEEGWKDQHRSVCGSIKVKNVREVLKHTRQKSKMRELLLERGIPSEVVVPEVDFFCEAAIRAPLTKATTLCHHKNGLIPPLKKDVLTYFSPPEIGKMFHWEESSDGITAVLSLPLRTDTEGKERTAEIRRHYAKATIRNIGETIPVIGLWPDFYAKDWQWYYFIAEKTDSDAEFIPISSRSLKQEGADVPGIRAIDRTQDTIWYSSRNIEAVECLYKKRPVGLILPSIKKALDVSNKVGHVSVDFGTSNTTVCFKTMETKDPELLDLKDKTLWLTESSPTSPKDFLSRTFMPIWEKGSMTSIFRRLVPAIPKHPMPVLDGIILHLDTDPAWPVMLIRSDEVKPGLKWSANENDRRLIVTFLQHLLLLIAAQTRSQGINNLTFYSSFPSAFPERWENELKAIWQQNVIPVLQERNLNASVDTERNVITESFAVCKYLRSRTPDTMEIGQKMPACIIDIGGGTTDLGVWTRTERGASLVGQASVLLAGGVLSDMALASKDFWKNFCDLVDLPQVLKPSSTFDRMRRSGDKRVLIPAAINTLLKTHGSAVSKAVGLASQTPVYLRARSVIFFAYGALFYYVGLILRRITEGSSIDGCSVFLAGNGAKLLDWIGNRSSVFNSLRKVLYTAANFDGPAVRGRILIKPPQEAKEEVARGLLVAETFDESVEPMKIIGETGYTYKAADLEWFRDMKKEKDIFSAANISRVNVPDSFPELESYIKIYNKEAERLGLKPLEAWDQKSIRGTIEDKLGAIAGGGADGELLQPFFVEEVKAVCKHYFISA